MKFIPILFSTPMVQAINEDRKTMTRRVIKPQPDENGVSYMRNPPLPWIETNKNPWKPWLYDTEEGERIATNCPYGEIGDVLWVRETFLENTGTLPTDLGYVYKAELGYEELIYSKELKVKWEPSLFMPKAACRTFLEITNIRVERLENISYKDAIAEGIDHVIDKVTGFCGRDYFSGSYNLMTTPVISFLSLWKKVNGLGRYDKTGNPWVWVIEFKKIEKPENFI